LIVPELADLDATGQAELVARGDLTPVELVEAAIRRIESVNPKLNAGLLLRDSRRPLLLRHEAAA
jgi:Asp-tRNA(Asn)/Glu-tRNA(Gln) amidotransferase A subunit family amidase